MDNDTSRTDPLDRARRSAAEIFYPHTVDTDPTARRVLQVRQIVAYIGVGATLVQIIVWLLIAVFGGALDVPWWLWTAVPSLALVALLTGAERRLRAEPAGA